MSKNYGGLTYDFPKGTPPYELFDGTEGIPAHTFDGRDGQEQGN
jgi:hypothetical protein